MSRGNSSEDGDARDDVVPLPELRREYISGNGQYRLSIVTLDNWRTPRAIGELMKTEGSGAPLWRRTLPQNYGSKYAVVSDQGVSVMLDEWHNVKSPYAVVMFDLDGRILAQHDVEAVREVLGIELHELTAAARRGWWLASAPSVTEDGTAVTVKAGGRILTIDLIMGEMRAQP